jgi:cardiolipin synthase
LLESGVRVFEWSGPMMHAKTAVADGLWARVGSTNLNMASWFGNCEMDAVIQDASFASQMEDMYLQDLSNATEVVLDANEKVRARGEPRRPFMASTTGGSAGRVAAGAIRVGNAIGAAFTHRRVLGAVEARLMLIGGLLLLGLGVLFWFYPRVLVDPVVVAFVWIGSALLYRGLKLFRQRKRSGG